MSRPEADEMLLKDWHSVMPRVWLGNINSWFLHGQSSAKSQKVYIRETLQETPIFDTIRAGDQPDILYYFVGSDLHRTIPIFEGNMICWATQGVGQGMKDGEKIDLDWI